VTPNSIYAPRVIARVKCSEQALKVVVFPTHALDPVAGIAAIDEAAVVVDLGMVAARHIRPHEQEHDDRDDDECKHAPILVSAGS
jgi:hypothetical protein